MRVAIYTRVSTADGDHQLESQLHALREHCARMGWEVVSESADVSPATDLRNRKQWRQLMDRCARPQPGFEAILVFKFDRACREIRDLFDSFQVMEMNQIKLVSATDLETITA